jgi:hypothetical protein
MRKFEHIAELTGMTVQLPSPVSRGAAETSRVPKGSRDLFVHGELDCDRASCLGRVWRQRFDERA